jgi:hypothetical protein
MAGHKKCVNIGHLDFGLIFVWRSFYKMRIPPKEGTAK